MKKALLTAAVCALACSCQTTGVTDEKPAWLETDSAEAIHQRLLRDFPDCYEVGAAKLIDAYPGMTVDSICDFVDKHYVEVMEVDGERRMFRKAARNLALLNPNLNGGWTNRGCSASPQRLSYADTTIKAAARHGGIDPGHRVRLRFVVDVPYDPALQGDSLRVWMPYPIESARQGDITLVATSQPDYVISTPEQSVHRTIYMQAPVAEGDTTHFEYEVELTTRGMYYTPEYIQQHIKPYDQTKADYIKYTAFDGPHYVKLDSLARQIVGDETNPYLQSEMVYDYIVRRYPWAGAREYSTIECIPRYVIDEGHGDCGQVALLYISLMRSLGVPARWESGWMLHPGEKNYHDWAEVYYEGVGWVPVDVSFGRYTGSDDQQIQRFYSTGIDSYRFATNTGIGGAFYPPKRYIRSETVDCQAGEVECSRGNLFYPAWDSSLQILEVFSF